MQQEPDTTVRAHSTPERVRVRSCRRRDQLPVFSRHDLGAKGSEYPIIGVLVLMAASAVLGWLLCLKFNSDWSGQDANTPKNSVTWSR